MAAQALSARLRAHADYALRVAARQHLYDPNVTLIDFGRPVRSGHLSLDEVAIRVHVRHKLDRARLEAAVASGRTQEIPGAIAGIATDVLQGSYHQHWLMPMPRMGAGWTPVLRSTALRAGAGRTARANPMQGGISISDAAHIACGTLGALVIDRRTRTPMLLGNWHVLANDWMARAGLPVYQPGRLDGGSAVDTVAWYVRDAMRASLDAAVAELADRRRLLGEQFDLGAVRGVATPELDQRVIKSGRGSGVTTGRVTAVGGYTRMVYGGLQREIRVGMTIEPDRVGNQVSTAGDSGSLWLDAETRRAVGLHFAGSDLPERALAMDIAEVLDALDVDLAVTR